MKNLRWRCKQHVLLGLSWWSCCGVNQHGDLEQPVLDSGDFWFFFMGKKSNKLQKIKKQVWLDNGKQGWCWMYWRCNRNKIMPAIIIDIQDWMIETKPLDIFFLRMNTKRDFFFPKMMNWIKCCRKSGKPKTGRDPLEWTSGKHWNFIKSCFDSVEEVDISFSLLDK